jgi:hypothetical protein
MSETNTFSHKLRSQVFTYKIPIVGISGLCFFNVPKNESHNFHCVHSFSILLCFLFVQACEFAGYLQVFVNAVDQIVNDCTQCKDSNGPKSSFSVLEAKLSALLQDGVGGTPSVSLTPSSDEFRSSLEVDVTLSWTFTEASQLKIDLAAILEGLDLDEDIKLFAKVRPL